jgi:hypothetical protein
MCVLACVRLVLEQTLRDSCQPAHSQHVAPLPSNSVASQRPRCTCFNRESGDGEPIRESLLCCLGSPPTPGTQRDRKSVLASTMLGYSEQQIVSNALFRYPEADMC